MLCQILLVKANMREIQPAISADHCQFDVALLQRLSYARGNEALSRCIDPADSNKQGVLWRKRFSLLDDRRNHRTIFEHELQLRSVIKAGSDACGKAVAELGDASRYVSSTAIIQYRNPVGGGPSFKSCLKCDPQRAHEISTPKIAEYVLRS